MTAYRIPGKGRVDHRRAVRFHFNGETYTGYQGDTLASALLANGIHLVGRSFKYHRPRGILSAGSEEPNALVGTDRGNGRFRSEEHTSALQSLMPISYSVFCLKKKTTTTQYIH